MSVPNSNALKEELLTLARQRMSASCKDGYLNGYLDGNTELARDLLETFFGVQEEWPEQEEV